ncbi:hypothetical protein RA279_28675, partial [Pseudomonas syringae pv. tagetis]|uniref:hypothetical protein n=1 Tax=Pseudomonas syringae group genomosp. 7 TaxID=251699 RepID=UPI0037705D86
EDPTEPVFLNKTLRNTNEIFQKENLQGQQPDPQVQPHPQKTQIAKSNKKHANINQQKRNPSQINMHRNDTKPHTKKAKPKPQK